MSYRVDPQTLLFDDLDPNEAKILYRDMEDIVLRGSHHYGAEAFQSWLKAAGYDNRQALLVLSTAYPQRALLSLLKYH